MIREKNTIRYVVRYGNTSSTFNTYDEALEWAEVYRQMNVDFEYAIDKVVSQTVLVKVC